MKNYDLVVIGAGPGGYVAAIRAAQLGLNVAVIEKEHLGGICLNWGCIPTKSLLKSAEMLDHLKHMQDYGISASNIKFDITAIVKRSRDISDKLVSGIGGLLKKNKITMIKGVATFASPKTLSINKQEISAKNIIIATGARAKTLLGFEPDGKFIWTYKEALMPKSVPKTMVIVGSGAIGIEFASFYNSLGVDVTVLEAQSRILPAEDEEISQIAQKSFEARGIKFFTDINLSKQNIKNQKIQIEFTKDGKKHNLKSDILLMAVGVIANTENLGLEKTKIILEKGAIVTDALMRTNESGIFAIGDITMPPWLAHKASHEGIIAAEVASGLHPKPINKNNIPACTYSSPQIASVGLTEKQAIDAGHKINVGKFPYLANGKALILNDQEGLIKTIFDTQSGELLGAHMIGSSVTELIHGYTITKELEGTEMDLIHTIFPHPTLSEMMHESVLNALQRQIHI